MLCKNIMVVFILNNIDKDLINIVICIVIIIIYLYNYCHNLHMSIKYKLVSQILLFSPQIFFSTIFYSYRTIFDMSHYPTELFISNPKQE